MLFRSLTVVVAILLVLACVPVQRAQEAGAKRNILTRQDLSGFPGHEGVVAQVEFAPGAHEPKHTHPGDIFGYVLEGEMVFELEGEPPRVIRAGETFWEPGGDVIHYQDGNNRDDINVRYVVTMLCAPGQPMVVLVDEEELAARAHLRVPAESSTSA